MPPNSNSPLPPPAGERVEKPSDSCVPRRGEIAFIAVFCLSNILVSASLTDYYPFSSMPMYSAAPQKITKFEAFDPEGNEVSRVHLRLYLPLRRVTNPNPRIGQKAPGTLNTKDEIVEDEFLVNHVSKHLAAFPELEYVTVRQQILGAKMAGGRRTVGLVAEKQWRVENPHFEATPTQVE